MYEKTVYTYDCDDNIIGMNYEGEFYYYQKNVLGDVTAVYDANGVCVAEYEYDAWGNCINQTGGQNENLGIDYINPIRYRSYYYENSVGMYYLQSRYYYATAGRFINADDPQIALDSKEDTDGTNLFAYCCNDPVNNVDYTGYWKENVHKGFKKNKKGGYTLSSTKIKGKKTYYGTYIWARSCGFEPENARKLGKYCQELDDKYPSTAYAAALFVNSQNDNKVYSLEQLAKFRKWQYYHFNGNKKGKDSRTPFAISRRNWAVTQWKKGNHDKALQYLGYGLHAVQDYHAHGNIGRGLEVPFHGALADSINYSWKNEKKRTILISDEYNKTRLRATAKASKDYITIFVTNIGGKKKV